MDFVPGTDAGNSSHPKLGTHQKRLFLSEGLENMDPIVLAICGASGSIYGVRLLRVLISSGREVHLTISPGAASVFQTELGISVDLDNFELTQLHGLGDWKIPTPNGAKIAAPGTVRYSHYKDFSAGMASGSFLTGGMVICPCSMGTLAAVSQGISSNLIHRAADVHLKERRRLIVVPRETPLGSIQLQNMKILADAGAIVLPAMPGFYHQPATIEDMVDFVVGRICDQLGLSLPFFRRWGTGAGEPKV
jgi:4-hydroxy-3-polyprenylbenzoate decarboxylase